MGTRADFYIGRKAKAKWLGSVAYDGHPVASLIKATTAVDYRREVKEWLQCDSATFPSDGWPWPWDDSRTSDYSYFYDKGAVHILQFGCPIVCIRKNEKHDTSGYWVTETVHDFYGTGHHKMTVLESEIPAMAKYRNLAPPGSHRSGFLLLG